MATYGYKQQAFGTAAKKRTPTATAANYQRSLYGYANDYKPTAPAPTPSAWGPGGPGWETQQGMPKTAAPKPQAPAKAPAGQPSQDPAQTPAANNVPAAYDWNSDPILQKVQALGTAGRNNARDEALKLKKQAAIQYGDENLTRQLVGDEGTALAAKGNPFSIVNLLRKDYEDENRIEGQQYNKRNLWYSGAHANELGENTRGYQQRTAEAAGGLQGLFGDIESQLANAILAANYEETGAEEAAYNRALEQALKYGIDPGPAGGSADAAVSSPVKTRDETKGGATPLRPFDPNDPFLANPSRQKKNPLFGALLGI
jgi:hypothetical protein